MISYRAWPPLVTFLGWGGVGRVYSGRCQYLDCIGSLVGRLMVCRKHLKGSGAAQLRYYPGIPRTGKSHDKPTSG
jgi:hypothetical protein